MATVCTTFPSYSASAAVIRSPLEMLPRDSSPLVSPEAAAATRPLPAQRAEELKTQSGNDVIGEEMKDGSEGTGQEDQEARPGEPLVGLGALQDDLVLVGGQEGRQVGADVPLGQREAVVCDGRQVEEEHDEEVDEARLAVGLLDLREGDCPVGRRRARGRGGGQHDDRRLGGRTLRGLLAAHS